MIGFMRQAIVAFIVNICLQLRLANALSGSFIGVFLSCKTSNKL